MTKPAGFPASARGAIRGDSWNSPPHPENCRAGYPNHSQPDNRNNNLCFRVACCNIRVACREAGAATFAIDI